MKQKMNYILIILFSLVLVSCKKVSFTIKHIYNNNKEDKIVTISKNSVYKELEQPKMIDHTFEGWFEENGESFTNDIIIKRDYTIYAKWIEDIKEEFTINFEPDNGNNSFNVKVYNGNPIIEKIETPLKDGYKFLGWYEENKLFDFNERITKNHNLTALWEKVIVQYKITIMYNNEKENTVYNVTELELINRLDDPFKKNHFFDNWYSNNEIYDFSKPVTSNLVIEARYHELSTAYQKITYALQQHFKSTNFEVNGTGNIKASIVKQTMKYKKARSNNEVYLFNGSYGNAILFKIRPYVEVIGNINEVIVGKGYTNKDLQKEEELTSEIKKYQDFSKEYGGNINSFNYIVNEENIVNLIDNKDNSFTLEMDLTKSTIDYIDYISAMNPEEHKKDSIIFSKSIIKITLDEDNLLKTVEYDEEYSIYVNTIIGWSNQVISSFIVETYKY